MGDRKVRIKLLPFLSLLLFRDEISTDNAAIYMEVRIKCCHFFGFCFFEMKFHHIIQQYTRGDRKVRIKML